MPFLAVRFVLGINTGSIKFSLRCLQCHVSARFEEVWPEMDTNCGAETLLASGDPRPARQRVIDKGLSVFESSWS